MASCQYKEPEASNYKKHYLGEESGDVNIEGGDDGPEEVEEDDLDDAEEEGEPAEPAPPPPFAGVAADGVTFMMNNNCLGCHPAGGGSFADGAGKIGNADIDTAAEVLVIFQASTNLPVHSAVTIPVNDATAQANIWQAVKNGAL